ncbi:MAG: PAS domain S-box protein [Candidatus Limnocylindrales bacterium]
MTTDLDGRITGWNAGAEGLYGWTRADALGNNVETLIGPIELDEGCVAEAARRGDSLFLGLVVRQRAGGDLVPVDLTISPIVDGGTVVGMSRISHDLRHLHEEQASAGPGCRCCSSRATRNVGRPPGRRC